MHATRVAFQPQTTRLHGRVGQTESRRLLVCHVTRREASLLAAVSWAALSPAAVANPPNSHLNSWQPTTQTIASPLADAAAAATPITTPSKDNQTTGSNAPCNVRLDPTLAAAFMQAAYDVVQQQQVMPEQQLQLERFRLQNQEYKYYAAANKDRMPQLPNLADNSGGLSNRLYYNFVSYCLWKTIAKHLVTPEQRTAFCAAVGEMLLPQLVPDITAAVQKAATGGQPAPTAVMIPAIQGLLNHLQQRGYLCGYQLVLGAQPGTWPADWARTEPQIVDDLGLLEQSEAAFEERYLAPGSVFQVGGMSLRVGVEYALVFGYILTTTLAKAAACRALLLQR
eukprot:GHUV01014479.1.p1 GENE.GHUV01014479.1~~GHUV01014479.1.p1  ORF type:complete len:339 (+),score=61.67 GHUV01014479.1:238-1254(+)